jgi:hypothetical protein
MIKQAGNFEKVFTKQELPLLPVKQYHAHKVIMRRFKKRSSAMHAACTAACDALDTHRGS